MSKINDDLMKALKSDLHRCINEYGDLKEKYNLLKKENKKLKLDLINAVTIIEKE